MPKNSILSALFITILLFGTTYSAVVSQNNLKTNQKVGCMNEKQPAEIRPIQPQIQPLPTMPRITTKPAFINGKQPALIRPVQPQIQPLPIKPQIQIQAPQTLEAIQALKPTNLLPNQPQIQAPQTLIQIQNLKPMTKPGQLITAPTETTVSQPNWSYLVGVTGSCASKVIKNQRPDLTVIIMKPGMAWTRDFRFDRVRISVNSKGVVNKTPVIG